MPRFRTTLAALALAGLLALAPPAHAQYAATFRVGGEVNTPVTYSLSLLQQLPSTRLNVYFNTGQGPVSAAFTGVLLWDLLNISGVQTDPNVKNDVLRKLVVVTGSDGYETTFSLGELDPAFGGEQVIVAYLQNDQPLDANSGFARIIAPNDKAGGRDVFSIVRIRVIGVR